MMNIISLVLLIIGSLVPISMMIYPLYVITRYLVSRRPVKKDNSFCVPVSIIIACHNEEQFIIRKIDSFLQEDEWIDGSEIIVVSTGSSDATNDLLLVYEGRGNVRIVIMPDRGSKIIAVNSAVSIAINDILVFSDCRQIMKAGSVKSMISNFCDPSIGTVTAELSTQSNTRGLLRKWLNMLARMESACGSSLNVFGALYAQRKDVYRKIPEHLLFDDLFVAASTLAQRKRLISDSGACIYDVDFNSYYGKNRLERLARGLMLFYTHSFFLVREMSMEARMRFLVFKYFKLLLPFSAAVLSLGILLSLLEEQGHLAMLWCFILLMLIFFGKRILFIRMLFFLGRGVVRYIIGLERGNRWDKIRVNKDLRINQS